MILPIVVDLWWMACMYSTILFRHWESHVCLDFFIKVSAGNNSNHHGSF